MSIVLNGSGSITGLTSGAGIAAAALSGQVPDANAPSGSVIQVVQGSSSTPVINNSSSFVDTGLTATITPSSTSNKVLVQAVVPFILGTNGGSAILQFRILRDATALTSNLAYNNVQYIVQLGGTQVIAWLDAPSSTSALTYKIQFKELSMGNRYGNTTAIPTLSEAQTGVIQVMEIAA